MWGNQHPMQTTAIQPTQTVTLTPQTPPGNQTADDAAEIETIKRRIADLDNQRATLTKLLQEKSARATTEAQINPTPVELARQELARAQSGVEKLTADLNRTDGTGKFNQSSVPTDTPFMTVKPKRERNRRAAHTHQNQNRQQPPSRFGTPDSHTTHASRVPTIPPRPTTIEESMIEQIVTRILIRILPSLLTTPAPGTSGVSTTSSQPPGDKNKAHRSNE
jgi:hypothetical protein